MGHELEALTGDNIFVGIPYLLRASLHLKPEFLNPVGSIEFKTAIELIRKCEAAGVIKRNTVLVECSSGDLGVALSIICAARGYRLKCVVGPTASQRSICVMRALGADVVCVSESDAGSEGADPRIEHIRELTLRDGRYVWVQQRGSQIKLDIHADLTAPAIADHFSRIDYLFINAGTIGVLAGCIDYFSRWRPETRIIAVDGLDRVGLGNLREPRDIQSPQSKPRRLSLDNGEVYSTVLVPDVAAVSSCRYLARSYGILAGPATGAVLTAVLAWRENFHQDEFVVAIAPDAGERYLDTIYNDQWVVAQFGAEVLLPELYTQLIGGCITSLSSSSERHGVAAYV